jgi:hypothetical protein
MDSVRRQDVPKVRLPGRDIQRLVGKGAALTSGRMTLALARYSDDAGPMEPHQHAEESIFVLDARDSHVRYGPSCKDLPVMIPLEPGITLHIPELEWHVFEWEPGGYADVIVIYGQVDNIRPEEIARA